jgi:PPOX class probable F420-dependent enzyme
MSREEVMSFLDEPRNAVLSTLGGDGMPHAAAMWFVASDDEVRMWTYAKSQKAVNLRRDPRCALLAEEGLAYDELRGVLIRGRARLIEDFDDISAIGVALYDRYSKPRTGMEVEEGPILEIERQAAKRVGVSLALADVASWDHRKLGNR